MRLSDWYFYPRSPCGERPRNGAIRVHLDNISIHALLAESDLSVRSACHVLAHFYPRSPCGERQQIRQTLHRLQDISIHALLAESDGQSLRAGTRSAQFLSTLSLRRATHLNSNRTIIIRFLSTLSLRRATMLSGLKFSRPRDFYPRSPCGERPIVYDIVFVPRKFLSTLSLRRATTWQRGSRITYVISIHALLAESDSSGLNIRSIRKNFYPRSPCGERHWLVSARHRGQVISIHALLAESDASVCPSTGQVPYFYPRSPCGERPGADWLPRISLIISIHALLAESDRGCCCR